MVNPTPNKASPTLSRKARGVALFVGLLTISLLVAYESFFRVHLQHPLQFNLRTRLGQDPKLDDRLKIYAFGDSSVAYLGREELTLLEWAKLLKVLDDAHPRAILIDQRFSQTYPAKEIETFHKTIKGLKTPVIVGAFVSPTPISYKAALSQEQLTSLGTTRLVLQSGFFYGPSLKLQKTFQKVGHFDFSHSPYLTLFFQGPPGLFLPAASLLTAKNLEVREDQIWVDGQNISVDSQAQTLVNFIPPVKINSSIYSFTNLLKRIESHDRLELPSDSVVVLMSSFYTGNAQMAESPYGLIPAGYVNVSAVNSVLGAPWLKTPSWPWLSIIVLATLGGCCGIFFQGLAFYGLSTVLTTLFAAGGLSAFLLGGWDLPWLTGSMAFSLTAAGSFFVRLHERGKQMRKLTEAFEGSLPPALLQSLLKNPSTDWLEPKNKVVTIVFIDVVGFSVMAETLGPSEVFATLKTLLTGVTEIIHQFGGTVDKSLGDGLICFFGLEESDFEGKDQSTDNHAERALRCAAEIQRQSAQRCLEAKAQGRPVLPLRVGINTAAVVIGNLGNQHRIDLTLIGHGVNMAQRMEAAAEPFLMMIGSATNALIPDPKRLGVKVTKRWAAVKHFSDLVEAYEVNPFLNEPELYKSAMGAHRETSGKVRVSPRYPVEPEAVPVAVPTVGNGTLVDVSSNGLGVILPRYLGRGVVVELTLFESGSKLEKKARAEGITPLFCEVKWGVELQRGSYFLGLSIKNLSAAKSESLLKLLKPYLQRKTKTLKAAA